MVAIAIVLLHGKKEGQTSIKAQTRATARDACESLPGFANHRCCSIRTLLLRAGMKMLPQDAQLLIEKLEAGDFDDPAAAAAEAARSGVAAS